MMSGFASSLRPFSRLDHPREVVRQFTPNWFAATMGTGILSIALAQIPARELDFAVAAEALWAFNIGLFVLFTGLYTARWIFFFDGARRIFGHSVVSMFFGCIPMGLATIINGFLIFGPTHWGEAAITIAEGLWWFDAALALACGILIPFLMFTRQSHTIDQMTAVWLLPVVAAEVAAVSGGLLAPHLADPSSQLLVLIVGYALWACSVPLAMSVLVILVLRMAVHKLPHASMAASSWLALGPIGTGALGLLVLGDAAPAIFAANDLTAYGPAAHGIGLIGALLLWGYGLWWGAQAVLITLRYLRHGLPFNLGWWGYTFPLGVYAVATLRLGTVLPIPAFTTFGQILVAGLAVLWLIVGARTLCGAWRGELFVSPCLKSDD
ncbi:TDT family transporter [Magnetospirillum molischianum]|uniref:C4-dicarboxylate transporter/malic acid transport protein n=1 Tax=Magnetospirillum molischianum DSM 120 TaxID=1150626 RepID=H8FPX2_MAGML|nr:TDT family transporter [Magnetospirillum molischianum]CCG40410.1 C4-dicarboxylate transporter/malic acid transport protein [Magnetospirillum molischianum DSM 120]